VWGLPGSYDPKRKMLYWSVANPNPYTRLIRHGSAEALSLTAPADLYLLDGDARMLRGCGMKRCRAKDLQHFEFFVSVAVLAQ
jgi:hypothetical protein